MGCADHRLSSVCHPNRTRHYVLHGNVGKGKKGKNRGTPIIMIGESLCFLQLGAWPQSEKKATV